MMQTIPSVLSAPEATNSNLESTPSTPAEPRLLPRPGRSVGWILRNSLWGTWFLIAAHVGALATFFTSPTWIDWALLPVFLLVRGLLTTVGYHRYFSHRAFKTSRTFQFVLGWLCCLNLQRGPLWWAAIHRHHHRHSDDEYDAHSPVTGSLLWSHCGWTFATLEEPDWNSVRDLTRYPEMVWLERFWLLPSILACGLLYLLGGWSMVCLDFFVSAVIVMHFTFAVNSLGHRIGSQRYATNDSSRNSYIMAFLTLGDGWHNNHHHHPHSANHGFFWWEIDSSYQAIRLLAMLGIVWDVRTAPLRRIMEAGDGAKAPAELSLE